MDGYNLLKLLSLLLGSVPQRIGLRNDDLFIFKRKRNKLLERLGDALRLLKKKRERV